VDYPETASRKAATDCFLYISTISFRWVCRYYNRYPYSAQYPGRARCAASGMGYHTGAKHLRAGAGLAACTAYGRLNSAGTAIFCFNPAAAGFARFRQNPLANMPLFD